MSIEEEAERALRGYIRANTLFGARLNRPPGFSQLAQRAAEIDLDKDMGLLGEWTEASGSGDWGFTDARLLRSARLDAAEAKYHASAASKFAWYAMSSAAKTYYVCLLLVALSIGQFGLIWWLLLRQS